MRNEAFKLSGFTLVISALGFMLRWLQDMRIADETTGLAVNAPISWMVLGLIFCTAGLLAGMIWRLRQFDPPMSGTAALVGKTPLYGVIAMLPPILMAAAGAIQIVWPGDVLWPAFHRVCGVFILLGAFGMGVVTVNAARPDGENACRKGAMMVMAFACVWLVEGYRDAATDPLVWRFLVGILAQCVSLLAIFYTVGYFFDAPHPWWSLFACCLGAFLCIMSAIDENGIAQSVLFAALAAQFFIWAFVTVENLKTKPLFPEAEQEE